LLTFYVHRRKSLTNKTADIDTKYPTHTTSKRFKILHLACVQLKDWCNSSISSIRLQYSLNWKLDSTTREKKKRIKKKKTNTHHSGKKIH